MNRIFSYGCPRSGTTVMQRVLQNGDFDALKIREGDRLHPCQSAYGLIALCQLYRADNVVFIRTMRDPVAIFESFYAGRVIPKMSRPPITGMVRMMDKLGKVSDERIYAFIEKECANTKTQIQKAKKLPWRFQLVQVQYDDLFSEKEQDRFLTDLSHYIGDVRTIRKAITSLWGKKPVREGRMSAGIKESLLPEGMKQEIEDRCSSL